MCWQLEAWNNVSGFINAVYLEVETWATKDYEAN